MSLFSTKIPVNVEAVKKLLPPDSFVEGVQWKEGASEVTLLWNNRNILTKYTFPVEFPVALLESGEIPAQATRREAKPPEPLPDDKAEIVMDAAPKAKVKRAKKGAA